MDMGELKHIINQQRLRDHDLLKSDAKNEEYWTGHAAALLWVLIQMRKYTDGHEGVTRCFPQATSGLAGKDKK